MQDFVWYDEALERREATGKVWLGGCYVKYDDTMIVRATRVGIAKAIRQF